MPQHHNILYSFRRCPYAMRARFAIAYSGLSCALREVDLKNKPHEMLTLSPKGTVPVLLLSDGTLLEQSMDIIHYALNYHDPEGWLYPDPAFVQAIVSKNDTAFAPALHKYKYFPRYPEATQADYLKHTEEIFIQAIEERLSHTAYVAGDRMSIIDIAIFPLIRQWAMVDPAWFLESSYRHIRQWLDSIQSTSLYNIVMKQYTPWHTGDAPVFFPSPPPHSLHFY